MTCPHFDLTAANGAGDIEDRYSTAARTYSMRAAGMYRTLIR